MTEILALGAYVLMILFLGIAGVLKVFDERPPVDLDFPLRTKLNRDAPLDWREAPPARWTAATLDTLATEGALFIAIEEMSA